MDAFAGAALGALASRAGDALLPQAAQAIVIAATSAIDAVWCRVRII